jgi:flagellar hook-length control protein FliK
VSTEAIAAAVGVPPEELAVTQRVRQLQTLIEQTRQVGVGGLLSGAQASGSSSPPAAEDFASALQAATTADVATADVAPLAWEDDSAVVAGAGSSEYDPLIEQAAARYGVDPAVLHGLIQQESGFDPSAESSAGAAGLTQLMPGTAASLGVANPLDPVESIEGGARYLGQLMTQFGGNTEDALAAYNAGPGAVQQYGGIPPYAETQSYVSKVLGYAEAYRQSHLSSAVAGTLGYTAGAPPGAPPGALVYTSALAPDSARTATAEGHKSTSGRLAEDEYVQTAITPAAGRTAGMQTQAPESIRSAGPDAIPGVAVRGTERDAESSKVADTLVPESTSQSKPASELESYAQSGPNAESAPVAAFVPDAAPVAPSASGAAPAALLAQDLPLAKIAPEIASADVRRSAPTVTVSHAQSDAGYSEDANKATRSAGIPSVSVEDEAADVTARQNTVAQQVESVGALSPGMTVAASADVSASILASPGTAAAPEADMSAQVSAGVPMQEMIDSIHATVAMAARQGIAQARIELQPPELGQISIRLNQTSAGLSARLSADTPAGVQALAQGGTELRQSLSSLGVSLLRLDIGSFGQPQAREQGERSSGRSEGRSASTATTTTDDGEAVGELDLASRPPGVARGEIVDVLA